jgi:hypothetical protein
MVTDQQVRRLWRLMQTERTLAAAAAKAGMDEKTARKYRRLGRLPSEVKAPHIWRTRRDPFDDVWEEVRAKLHINAGLQAKTLFEDLQRRYPGRFADGQLRTLQRRVKAWRALEGPPKEVFFPQRHEPGELCQSDFTHMNSLGVTILGRPFDHMIYHFVLTYSNWEWGTICFSESFESLSEGLQNALWKLGGVPKTHRTDRLSTAVHKTQHPEEFTRRYAALLNHYGLEGCKTQAGHPNEIGDVEQRHWRFKKALEQALMLRGSRDFAGRAEYVQFVRNLLDQLNAGRKDRLAEELKVLRRLPASQIEACKREQLRVGPSSTIRVNHNVYSVHSRLIGETVNVRVFPERLEVWYGQRLIETLPRLRGEGRCRIQYRHIIDWLVRKPGAFENYVYRHELYPTSHFRMAYDDLMARHAPSVASKQYLRILHLAARENQSAVDQALRGLFDREEAISAQAVQQIVRSGLEVKPQTDVVVPDVELAQYDGLLEREEVS